MGASVGMASLRLSDRVLRRLQTEARACEYTDPNVAGFGVRVFSTGRISFFLRYYAPVEQQEKRVTFGYYCTPDQKQRLRSSVRLPPLSLAEARDKAKELLGILATGSDPDGKTQEAPASLTFTELANQYLQRHARLKKRPASAREDARILNRDVLPCFGSEAATEVSVQQVVELLDRIVDRGSPIMANRTLALLRKVFNWGRSRGVIESNPTWGLEQPASEKVRDRVFTTDEISVFWGHLRSQTPVVASAFRLLFLTMQRAGEILAIRDSWFGDDLIEIPRESFKGKRLHVVPLSTFALDEVARAREQRVSSGLLLPSPRTGRQISSDVLAKAARRYRDKLDFDSPVTPHDIRRTVFTRLAKMGYEEGLLHRIAGHAPERLSRTYNRYAYLEERREALETWATELRRIVGADGR